MLFLISLIFAICASVQPHEFQYMDSYFYHFCNSESPSSFSSYFCEPFFYYFRSAMKPFPSTDECKDCETIINDLRKEGHVSKVVDNFVNSISIRFCDSLKEEQKENCRVWIKTYSASIKSSAIKQIENGQLCQNLFKCKTELMNSKNDIKLFPICERCIEGVKGIEEKYFTGLNFKNILETVDHYICRTLPMSTYVTCNQVSRTIADKFMKVIVQFNNATRLCSDIQLCPPTPSQYYFFKYFSSFFSKDVTSETMCDMCTNVTSEEFTTLKKSISVENMRHMWYNILCDDLTEKHTCKSFVDTALDVFVSHVQQILTTDGLCYDLLKCQKHINPPYPFFDFSHFFKKNDNKNIKSDCMICDLMRNMLLRTVKDSRTIDVIEFVYKAVVCQRPNTNVDECERTMRNEISQIIDRISKHLESGSICNKVCSSNYYSFKASPSVIVKPCVFCERFINDLKRSIGSRIEDEAWVDSKIKSICESVPSNETEYCKTVIREHGVNIKSLLMLRRETEEICFIILRCPRLNYFYNMYSEYQNYPYSDFYKYSSSFPKGYFDNEKSYPFSYFFYKYSSYPFSYFSKQEYPYKFFESEKEYPYSSYSSMENSYPYFPHYSFSKSLEPSMPSMPSESSYKSYPFSYYRKDMSYPFEFFNKKSSYYPYSYLDQYKSFPMDFESYFHYNNPKFSYQYSFFPYYFYYKKGSEAVSECEYCNTYVEDLKRLQKQHLENPTFWHALVDQLCKAIKIDSQRCELEIKPQFAKLMELISSGVPTSEICKKSCTKTPNFSSYGYH